MSSLKTEREIMKLIDIRCPVCGSRDYLSYEEIYDGEWISLKCQCLVCNSLFQINYRAVGIDKLKGTKNSKDDI